VRRDHVVVGSAAWGVASPVDPGDHVIEVSAPGHKAWSTRVTVGDAADRESVDVPALEQKADDSPANSSADEAPANSPPPVPESTHRGGTQRAISYVVGAAGIVSLGVGTAFGIMAISKSNDAKSQCTSVPSPCPPSAVHEMNSVAKTDALISDVTVGVGIVAVGVGLYLLLSAPSDAPASTDAPAPATSRVRWQPLLGRNSAGLSLEASF